MRSCLPPSHSISSVTPAITPSNLRDSASPPFIVVHDDVYPIPATLALNPPRPVPTLPPLR